MLGSADNSYLSITNGNREKKDSIRRASGHAFTFIAETAAGRSIPGSVSLVDKRGTEISSFKTGESVIFRGKEGGGLLMLVCQVPGYSAEMKLIQLGRLSGVRDIQQRDDGVWEVRFRVRKMKTDEINFLYQEMFHADAAILQSGAEKQIDVLLSLLRKNPGWRVVFNIHCNRGGRRKIAVPGRGNDYFDMDGAKVISATDSKLTDERGRALKDYLVSKGIDDKRITLMGWGSVNLLVPDTAENAGVNERIEVEFMFQIAD